MIKSIEDDAIVVTPVTENNRLLMCDDIDLHFQYGRDQVIKLRDLRSHELKKMLIDNRLKVVNGLVEFDYKGEHFVFEPEKSESKNKKRK